MKINNNYNDLILMYLVKPLRCFRFPQNLRRLNNMKSIKVMMIILSNEFPRLKIEVKVYVEIAKFYITR